ASDFIIERGPPGGALTPIPGLALVKGVTHTDQPLPAGTTFLYQVRATWGGFYPSNPSNIASATTVATGPTPPPPGVPPPPPPPPPGATWKIAYNVPLTVDDNNGGAGWTNTCKGQ